MSRGKQRRKYRQKIKRVEKKKRGRIVRFSLANSSRKYPGIKNKYCYQTNIHNLIYKDGNFENVKYQASDITKCNFKNTKLAGVDFFNTNLKNTSFKGAQLKNVVFYNCNLKETSFENVKFYNVIFIATNTSVARNLVLDDKCRIMKSYPKIQLDVNTETAVLRLSQYLKIYKYHVLHVNKNKMNMWILKILHDRYGSNLGRALNALIKRKQKWGFFTLSAYIEFIERYLKI